MEDLQSFSTSYVIMEDIYLEYIWKKRNKQQQKTNKLKFKLDKLVVEFNN